MELAPTVTAPPQAPIFLTDHYSGWICSPTSSSLLPAWYCYGSIMEFEGLPDEMLGLETFKQNNANVLQNMTFAKS